VERLPRRWVGAALGALLVITHCTLTTGDGSEGLRVEVELYAAASPSPRWSTPNGATITLDRGWIALSSTEIAPCEGSAAAWGWPSLGVAPAWAHSPSAPRKLGVPGVLPLIAAEETVLALGELRPPPGRYCDVRVELGPADADAEGAPAEVGMVGRTLWLEGSIDVGDGAPSRFTLESSTVIDARVACPFELDQEHTRSRLQLTLDSRALLDGEVPAALLEGSAADRVLDRAARSIGCISP
jgi:hypothetical protein